MSTLAEIEAAVEKLPLKQQERLLLFLTTRLSSGTAAWLPVSGQAEHSALDIAPVSVGKMLRPLAGGDDLLDEMLDERV